MPTTLQSPINGTLLANLSTIPLTVTISAATNEIPIPATCTVLNVDQSQALYAYISGYCELTGNTSMIAPFLFEPVGTGALYFHAVSSLPAGTPLVGIGVNNVWYAPHPAVTYPTVTQRAVRMTKPAILRRRLLTGRKALRRSIDLYCSLRPIEELQTFMRGEPLLIRGHRFNYRIRKRANVLVHSIDPSSPHIPYHLSLMHPHTGKELSNGCVILRNTPVIDQLLAFILHAESPDDELLMLRRTNWTPELRSFDRPKLRLAA